MEKPTIMKTIRIDAGKDGIELPRIAIMDWAVRVQRGRYENVSKAISFQNQIKPDEIKALNEEMGSELQQVNWTDYYSTANSMKYTTVYALDGEPRYNDSVKYIEYMVKKGNMVAAEVSGPYRNRISEIGFGLLLSLVRLKTRRNADYDSGYFTGINPFVI